MRISGPRVDSEDWLSEEVILKEEPGGLGRSQGREEEEWPGGQDEVRLVVPGAFLAPSFPFEKCGFSRGREGEEAGRAPRDRLECLWTRDPPVRLYLSGFWHISGKLDVV